jgi:hypothetical protein
MVVETRHLTAKGNDEEEKLQLSFHFSVMFFGRSALKYDTIIFHKSRRIINSDHIHFLAAKFQAK